MAIVKKYPAKIVAIHNSIEGVYTLEFESLDKPFKYAPGQFLHLAIDDDYDGSGQWPDSRCFSMQSNPDEEIIKITYAVKGKFTRQMEKTLQVGFEVWLKLPYGHLFTQPHNKTNTVFIAGGTGITPYLSLLTHRLFKEYINPHIYLGFRSKKHNIYQEEFTNIQKNHFNFSDSCHSLVDKFVQVFYEDIDGIINIKKILSENSTTSYYFISGPPIMIKTFRETLVVHGVPAENILTDDWQ